MTADDLKIMEYQLQKLQRATIDVTATCKDLFTSLRIVVETMERQGWHRTIQGDYHPAYTRALNSLERVRRMGEENEPKN